MKSEGYIYLSEWARKNKVPYSTAYNKMIHGSLDGRTVNGRVYVKEWEDTTPDTMPVLPPEPHDPSFDTHEKHDNCFCDEMIEMRKRHAGEIMGLILKHVKEM